MPKAIEPSRTLHASCLPPLSYSPQLALNTVSRRPYSGVITSLSTVHRRGIQISPEEIDILRVEDIIHLHQIWQATTTRDEGLSTHQIAPDISHSDMPAVLDITGIDGRG